MNLLLLHALRCNVHEELQPILAILSVTTKSIMYKKTMMLNKWLQLVLK